MSEDDDGSELDLTDEEDEAWCEERREEVEEYLEGQGVRHGGLGEWPAWHVSPYVSVWAIESAEAPGFVGWWVICGDLPTDYCSSDSASNPRQAMRHFAETWLKALRETPEGAKTLGETGLPAHLSGVLQSRAEILIEWVEDEDGWDDETPDSDSARKLH